MIRTLPGPHSANIWRGPMRLRYFLLIGLLGAVGPACLAGDRTQASTPSPATPTYLITNDDPVAIYGDNSVSFFQAGGSPSAPTLTFQSTATVGAAGAGGGNFGAPRIISLPDANTQCLYATNGGTGEIVSLNVSSQMLTGTFNGSADDQGMSNGIGLALNSNYLYASFTDSNTIGTFQILPGCQLAFVGDTTVGGLNGGGLYAIAANANILIATYGDGSIQSFNIAAGMPVSNDDEQDSTGFTLDNNNLPTGIDISADGRYAIFGDGAIQTLVEVSDISSGKLTPTRVYNLGVGPNPIKPAAQMPGTSSSNVRLSPDESLLYISNNQSGTVTAALFNASAGTVAPGCTSPRLNNFYAPWFYLGSLVTEGTTGTGGVLYVGEFGVPSSIAVLKVQTSGRTCILTEAAGSPVIDPVVGVQLLSIWAFPPRPF